MTEHFLVNSYVFSISFPLKRYNAAKLQENKNKTHQNQCDLVLIKSPSVPDQVSYIFQLLNQLFSLFFCLLIAARFSPFSPLLSPSGLCCSITQALRVVSLVP